MLGAVGPGEHFSLDICAQEEVPDPGVCAHCTTHIRFTLNRYQQLYNT